MSGKRRRKHARVDASVWVQGTGRGVTVRVIGWDRYGRRTQEESRFLTLDGLVAMAFPEGIPKEGDYVEEIAD